MGFYEAALRPLLFRMDPEAAHNLAFKALESGMVRAKGFDSPVLRQTFFDTDFANPLGLGAGFDKNARAVSHWHQLGFGFSEIGTVTWHAQPGNPKPRLFRVPSARGLINRMGFNNEGAEVVAERLSTATSRIPLGINLGKSKVTPLDEAAEDYRKSFCVLKQFGQYFVVNVSSPNTPGLRSLQEKGPLREIFSALRSEDPHKPLFVKVAPDLEFEALDDVVEVALEQGLTGIIATNTTISREGLPESSENRGEAGGLSGAPLRERSDAVLRHLSQQCGDGMVLVGVGGIFDGDDLYRKISLGAHLCQVYTGWIYGGPDMVPRTLRELAARMDAEGFRDLESLRGTASAR